MPVVKWPLPVEAPPLPGGEHARPGLLWASVERLAQFVRALVGGSLVEWHEDEHLATKDGVVLIPHGLGRAPRFLFLGACSDAAVVLFHREKSDAQRFAIEAVKLDAAGPHVEPVVSLLLL